MNKLSLHSLVLSALAIIFISAGAMAATFTVTKATNSNDGVCDADCSLREAVAAADSGDIVVFNSNLVGQTFQLGGTQIVITKRITIDGMIDSVNVAFVSGGNTNRHFLIQTGGGLVLRNMILVQGNGFINNNVGDGGSIFAENATSVSLDRVSIRGNQANNYGAIRLSTGTHEIINSSITGNRANSCTAIQIDSGSLYMANVTVSNNKDLNGGQGAGAICNAGGNLFIRNSTIAFNDSGEQGGGIFNGFASHLTLGNTIVAQNTSPLGADIRLLNGEITSLGGNLIGDLDTIPAGTFNKTKDVSGVNPLLAPTNSQQGGHPVDTHPLQAGSPAINGGINGLAVDPLSNTPLTNDARGTGFTRTIGSSVDKGAFEDQTNGFTLVVSKLGDSNDGACDTDCSLREAVLAAGVHAGTDTITMAANVFGTMTLTMFEIPITNQNVNIVGYPALSSSTLVISGNNASRLFFLNNSSVTFTGLTMANGTGQGASEPFGGGALVAFGGSLTLDRVIVRNSSTGQNAPGGGISTSGVNVVRIMNSTINNNLGGQASGASINASVSYITNTTISTNIDPDGGLGFGALSVGGTLYMRNSTIANNRASDSTNGAGLYCGPSSTCNLGNNIISDNLSVGGPDIFVQPGGTLVSVGGNLIETTSGYNNGIMTQSHDQIGVDPSLLPLGDNGGNVTTHMPGPLSAAVNNGVNAVATDPFSAASLATDARGSGFTRILSNVVDKGAVETSIVSAPHVSISGRVTGNGAGLLNARVVLVDSQGGTRTVKTSNFGFYHFDDIESGQTYSIYVLSKRFRFATRMLNVADEVTNFDFQGLE